MTRIARSRVRDLARSATVALLLAGLAAPIWAPTPPATAQPVGPTAAAEDDYRVSIETSAPAIPPDGTFGYTASVRLSEPVSYIQARLQLRRPSGRLIYQKTFVQSGVTTETASFSWSRGIEDVGLEPGSYPLLLSFVFERAGKVERKEVTSELRVYDPDAAPLPVAVVARIESVPLSDPAGRFVVDPARATGSRDTVLRLCELVLGNPKLRLSLAIPPLTLEEWRRISEGYETAGLEGVSAVPEESEVPLAYANALETLSRTAGTGRLEILDVPYADPDASELQKARLLGDLRPHFAVGHSALFRALDATAVAGTVLAGQCLPKDAVPLLEGSDIGFALVEPGCTRSKESTAASGAYRLKGTKLRAGVTDIEAAQAISSGNAPAALAMSFERQREAEAGDALIAVVDLGVGREATVDRIEAFLRDVADAPWADLTTVTPITDRDALPEIELVDHETQSEAPAGYWAEVTQGRRHARGLEKALDTADPQVSAAIQDSLVSESSSWAGPDGRWSLADRGRSFAASATRIAKSVLDGVSVKAVDITLSSARGSVPVSIANAGDKTLELTLRVIGDGFRVVGEEDRTIEVPPQETVVDIPVDLRSAISGRLIVELRSGPIVVDRAEARVSASVLDRLAVIVAIILVGLAALYFIVRRVRSVETDESSARPSA